MYSMFVKQRVVLRLVNIFLFVEEINEFAFGESEQQQQQHQQKRKQIKWVDLFYKQP